MSRPKRTQLELADFRALAQLMSVSEPGGRLDVFDQALALRLRAIERIAPELVDIGEITKAWDPLERVPYFDVEVTKRGRRNAAVMTLPSRELIGFRGDEFARLPDHILLNVSALKRAHDCPTCGAHRGHRCVTTRGKREGWPIPRRIHSDRTPCTAARVFFKHWRRKYTEAADVQHWSWTRAEGVLRGLGSGILQYTIVQPDLDKSMREIKLPQVVR